MSFTNSTPNYGLPQYIGTDKPTYLGDMNTAYATIDAQMKDNADAASAATSTANTAAATATAASTNATTALNTANSAASEAASATSAAANATSTANNAATDAAAALRASAANTIENLAPAYDSTLTYEVGDLVTYIDAQNSGKLYKCIVAVNTPMDFNINYWDDLTTSEVYAIKPKLVYELVVNASDLWIDILTTIKNNFVIDTTKVYRLVVSDSVFYNLDIITANSIRFSNVDFKPTPARIVTNVISIGSFTANIAVYINNEGTSVYADYGNTAIGGDTTIKIYEI